MTTLINTITIILTSVANTLKSLNPTHTVEAEYGAEVVEGSVLTLAHHGERSHNPAPCDPDLEVEPAAEGSVIGVSHIDLDTLGGLAKLLDHSTAVGKFINRDFWTLAAFVDVNGPHKLLEWTGPSDSVELLYAFWAYSEQNKIFAPRDGSALDVTADVVKYLDVIQRIFDYDPELLAAGKAFREREDSLNRTSFRETLTVGDMRLVIRSSENFTNHLYTTATGIVCDAVLAYNEKFKSLTLSFSDGQGNACELMQKAFGPEAGGHKGIAGTPRGVDFVFDDHMKVIEQLDGWKVVTI